MAEVYYIEGSDYTGKTTLINNLSEYIQKQGKTVLILKEPNGYFREQLLGGEEELTFFERRLFFLTCHLKTREFIGSKLDQYDYIVVDRSAVVSDMMHLKAEGCSDDGSEYIARALRRAYRSMIRLQEECEGASFEPHLVLLHIDGPEFMRRVTARAADIENSNDLKGIEFKKAVYDAYKHFIYEDTFINNMIKDFFCTEHILDDDTRDSRGKAKFLYDTIMKGGKQ